MKKETAYCVRAWCWDGKKEEFVRVVPTWVNDLSRARKAFDGFVATEITPEIELWEIELVLDDNYWEADRTERLIERKEG